MAHSDKSRLTFYFPNARVLSSGDIAALQDESRRCQLAPPRPTEATATTSLEDLRPHVFGHGPLDLQQELVVRVVVEIPQDDKFLLVVTNKHRATIGGREDRFDKHLNEVILHALRIPAFWPNTIADFFEKPLYGGG